MRNTKIQVIFAFLVMGMSSCMPVSARDRVFTRLALGAKGFLVFLAGKFQGVGFFFLAVGFFLGAG